MNLNLPCRLEEEKPEETEENEEQKSEIVQPVVGISGGWKLWEGYPVITRSVMMLQKTFLILMLKLHVMV